VHIAAAPGGSVPSIQVGGTFLGSLGAAAAQLEKLYAAAGSHPSSPFMETTSWLHAMLVEAGCASLTVNQCHLPGQAAGGRLSRASEYAKSDLNLRFPHQDAADFAAAWSRLPDLAVARMFSVAGSLYLAWS